MVMTNGRLSASAADISSGYSVVQGSPGWLSGRRGLGVGAAIAAASAALALGQHWLAVADLVPLLFVLPCAVTVNSCRRWSSRSRCSPQAATSPPTTATSSPSTAGSQAPSPCRSSNADLECEGE